jgi:hypothetical protein
VLMLADVVQVGNLRGGVTLSAKLIN